MAARGKKGGKKKAQKGRLGALVASFLFGEPLDDATASRVRELFGLAMIGAGLWLFLSLWTFHTPPHEPRAAGKNLGGLLAHYLADGAFRTPGVAGYLLAVLGVCWGCIIVARKVVDLPALRVMGAAVFVFSFAFVLDLGFGEDLALREGSTAGMSTQLPYGPGGFLAYVYSPVLVERFGSLGLWILLLTTSCISFMLATEMAFYPALRAFEESTV